MFDTVDYFSDETLINDPHPYFDWVRKQGPVWIEPTHGVAIVTGYHEVLEVYKNPNLFSSCNAASGPFARLPFEELEGDDIQPLVDKYGDQLPLRGFMATSEPARHAQYRGLMTKMFSPKRLQENGDFMWRLADRQLDEILGTTSCEFIHEFSEPFTILIIADLLGVPEEDRTEFRAELSNTKTTGTLGEDQQTNSVDDQFLHHAFREYIVDRRRAPRDDVLTILASAEFPDGSRPEVDEVVREAVFLFVAGQETTARLLGAQMLFLAEDGALQSRLRSDRTILPNFVEETLRLESPSKCSFRMARHTTTLGGVDIPAGTTLMMAIAAVNHDPDRFDHPHELDVDRANASEHVTFIRGAHTCLGQMLARAESRVGLERILDRMGEIRIDEEFHGPAGARRYEYDPTFLLRGLEELHLRYTPIG